MMSSFTGTVEMTMSSITSIEVFLEVDEITISIKNICPDCFIVTFIDIQPISTRMIGYNS